MTHDEAERFFSHYADRFSAGDGDAIADLWRAPACIADTHDGAARMTTWAEDAPLRANMRALCQIYAKAGPHHWRFALRQVQALGPHHAMVVVDWTQHRADGEVIQRFATAYQLGRQADGWRVRGGIAFEEVLAR